MDNAPSHLSGAVAWPERFIPIPLPPYSPELNPAEQVFRQMRQALSNVVFESLDALMNALTELLRECWEQPERIIRLCGYPWWVEAAQTIRTS